MSHFLIFQATAIGCGHEMLAIVYLPAINPYRRLDLKITVFRYRNSQINQIIHGKGAITADTALRLGRFFKMSPHFWLNLQNRFDLEVTEDQLADRLDKEVHAINTDVAYRKLNRDFIETDEGAD
jgi:addiction module HigA family antidote